MAALGGKKPVRIAVVALLAALLAFQSVRTAAVADRELRPGLAATLWPSHPAILTDQAYLAVAAAAADGKPVPPATRSWLRTIARSTQLSPDPFLIEGAIAQAEGQGDTAERLLLAARNRDPRSRGARFLLADHYLRTGRITAGLIEIQALVSVQAQGAEAFGPALVAYARAPGAVSQLRSFFRKYPRVEASVLSVLASDAANADLVLALATNDRVADPDWRTTLVTGLAAAGQYAKAYATWARVSRIHPSYGLFNPGFAKLAAPAPFNWHFPQTSEGVAEPDGKGGLNVLHYGRAKAVLARQLMLLRPGEYRLTLAVDSTGGDGALRWILRCASDQKLLLDLPLRRGSTGGSFTVPDGCEAQWLELQGDAGETAVTTELTIRGLRLVTGGTT